MKFWGCFFVSIGSISFIGFVFAAIVSKLFPLSDNPIIQAIQNDRYTLVQYISGVGAFCVSFLLLVLRFVGRERYYCFLAPLTLPALLVAVYFHWLSMKLFKHA